MARQTNAVSTRTLTITSLEPKTTGVGPRGDWTLYTVKAINGAGEPIDADLVTFQQLPIGVELEVDIEPREHPKHGTNYRIHARRNLATQTVGDLARDLQALTQRVLALEEQRDTLPPAATGNGSNNPIP